MRPVVLLIILFILSGALVLTFLPNGIDTSSFMGPNAPGQQRVPTWPGKQRIAPYRPGPAIGASR
jgi:hypothetical protein